MPLTVRIRDEIETFRPASAPGTEIRYRRAGPGEIEDAVADSMPADSSKPTKAEFLRALWGRTVVGWSGLVEPNGNEVPVEVPPWFTTEGKKLPAERQRAWVSSVIRGLPANEKEELRALVLADVGKAEEALGN